MSTLFALNLNKSAGKVAIFNRGYTTNHFHLLDIIGRKRTHVDTCIGKIAIG